MYFIQGKDIKMKITRRQIRRIIREAVEASDQDKEAAFAIIYTSDYIQGYMERAYNAFFEYRKFFNKTQEQRKQVSEYQARFLKFIDALEKLTNTIMDPIFTLDVEYDGLDTPERDSIEREGKDNAELDFGDSIFKGIEEMNKLVEEIWLETRTTIVFVTHSIQEAIFLSDRVMVMTNRPGTIKVSYGIDFDYPREPKILTTPKAIELTNSIKSAIFSRD